MYGWMWLMVGRGFGSITEVSWWLGILPMFEVMYIQMHIYSHAMCKLHEWVLLCSLPHACVRRLLL